MVLWNAQIAWNWSDQICFWNLAKTSANKYLIILIIRFSILQLIVDISSYPLSTSSGHCMGNVALNIIVEPQRIASKQCWTITLTIMNNVDRTDTILQSCSYQHCDMLMQTCQVSRFNRETHDFWCFLTISRLSPEISRFLAKSQLKPQVIPNTRGKTKYAIISCVVRALVMYKLQCQNFVCVKFVLESKRRVLLNLLSC
jgi:hypothetical protein